MLMAVKEEIKALLVMVPLEEEELGEMLRMDPQLNPYHPNHRVNVPNTCVKPMYKIQKIKLN